MPVKTRKSLREAKPGSKGIDPLDCRLDASVESLREVVERVEREGGAVVDRAKIRLAASHC